MDGCIKKYDTEPQKMLLEDLCALDKITEERIADLLKERLSNGDSYTFVGDVLISLNSNELPNEYPRSVSYAHINLFHSRHCFPISSDFFSISSFTLI